MQAADAERGRTGARRALGVADGRRAKRPERDQAHGVVRLGREPAVRTVARLGRDSGRRREQRRRDDGRVGIHARDVDESAVSRAVEFAGRRCAVLGPVRLVPAVAEHRPPPTRPAVPFDPVERVGQRRGRREVEAGERQAGPRGVGVRIDERRRHECAVEVNGPFRLREPTRVVTDPRDQRAVDDQCVGVGMGRCIYVAVPVESAHPLSMPSGLPGAHNGLPFWAKHSAGRVVGGRPTRSRIAAAAAELSRGGEPDQARGRPKSRRRVEL